jgi:D-glycero-alpha-D-manno-heptose-7-phosphate kinase
LSNNLILYHTKTSRVYLPLLKGRQKISLKISLKYIEATHKLKEQAVMMKEAILKGKIDEIGPVLDFGWTYKKKSHRALQIT